MLYVCPLHLNQHFLETILRVQYFFFAKYEILFHSSVIIFYPSLKISSLICVSVIAFLSFSKRFIEVILIHEKQKIKIKLILLRQACLREDSKARSCLIHLVGLNPDLTSYQFLLTSITFGNIDLLIFTNCKLNSAYEKGRKNYSLLFSRLKVPPNVSNCSG